MCNNIENIKIEFEQLKCCVLIPTYNNSQTIQKVIKDILVYTNQIIVVNDGSTDETDEILNNFKSINIVSYTKNKGKGYAIRKGISKALNLGYNYVITIDSDGQHYASDLETFVNTVKNKPNSLLIGNRFMEGKNQSKASGFANKFSNFWFWVETGIKLADTQSGYRLYPIKKMEGMHWFCSKYEFEIEIIVRAAWNGINVECVPIDVYYPSTQERITHFRPFADFLRISILNTILVILAFVYFRPRIIYYKYKNKSLKQILKEQIKSHNESNARISLAIGFGVFMGIFPVWGYQLLIGFAVAHLLKLNKGIFFIAANISIPPMIPVILYLSYVFGSLLLGEMSWQVDAKLTLADISTNIKQYLIGAVGLAVAMGLIFYGISYILLSIFKNK